MDGVLHCNFARCHTKLSNTAWVAVCNHIFCEEHASTVLSEDRKCPLCSTELNERHDMTQLNLNIPYEHRMMCLAGFNPKAILEIGSKAMVFWKFQIFHDKLQVMAALKNLRVRLAQSESSLHTTNNLNSEIQKQTQKCSILEKKLEEYKTKVQELETKIEYKNRMIYSLYMKVEAQRKQMVSQQQQQPTFTQEEINRQCRGNRTRIAPSFVTRTNDQGFRASQETPKRPVYRFSQSSQR